MKRLLILLFVLMLGNGYAQKKFATLGIKGGVNFSNFNGNVRNIDFSIRSSYHIGVFTQFRLIGTISFMPEMIYSAQGAKVESGNALKDFKLDYLTFPMVASIDILPGRLNLDVGPQFGILTKSNFKHVIETESFDFGVLGGLTVHLSDHFFIQGRYVAGLSEFSRKADVKNTNIQISLGARF